MKNKRKLNLFRCCKNMPVLAYWFCCFQWILFKKIRKTANPAIAELYSILLSERPPLKFLMLEVPFHLFIATKPFFWTRSILNNMLLKLICSRSFQKGTINIFQTSGVGLGDTMLVDNMCRAIKEAYPGINVNAFVSNPEIIQNNPDLTLCENWMETYYHQNYPLPYILLKYDDMNKDDMKSNILKKSLQKIRINKYTYQAKLSLSNKSLLKAKSYLSGYRKPIIVIQTKSKNSLKNWPEEFWHKLTHSLQKDTTVIQIGLNDELLIDGVVRFAGKLPLDETLAVLSMADIFVGPVSFFMHAANGLNIQSIIIYGGAETPRLSGYKENVNLYNKTDCSPCLFELRNKSCPYNMKCMYDISPNHVANKIKTVLLS